MSVKNREHDERLERFLNGTFRESQFTGGSDDEAFLAGFYSKLSQGLRVQPPGLGDWCWKMTPITGLVSLLLSLSFLFGTPGATAAPELADEQVLTLLSENPEGDRIVELILHEGSEP